jgi:hypothetical protein
LSHVFFPLVDLVGEKDTKRGFRPIKNNPEGDDNHYTKQRKEQSS